MSSYGAKLQLHLNVKLYNSYSLEINGRSIDCPSFRRHYPKVIFNFILNLLILIQLTLNIYNFSNFRMLCLQKLSRLSQTCTRSYIGAMSPGLSKSGIKKAQFNQQVPRINRSQYKIYLETLDKSKAFTDTDVTFSNIPPVPGALPSGWVPPPQDIPDLPYFVWRNVDKTLPVEHKESEEFRRFTQLSKIEGDIQELKSAIERFLDDSSIPVVANEVQGTVTLIGWRAFEIKKFLQLQGF